MQPRLSWNIVYTERIKKMFLQPVTQAKVTKKLHGFPRGVPNINFIKRQSLLKQAYT